MERDALFRDDIAMQVDSTQIQVIGPHGDPDGRSASGFEHESLRFSASGGLQLLAFAHQTFLFEDPQILGDRRQAQAEFPLHHLLGGRTMRIQIFGKSPFVKFLHDHGRRGVHISLLCGWRWVSFQSYFIKVFA